MSKPQQWATQDSLLLEKLMKYYEDKDKLNKMLTIINGQSTISLRIVDWFATNYSKKYYTVYPVNDTDKQRFKVYHSYKLHLKSYSKKKFDPFCRWTRITIPNDEHSYIQTTLGQLNFFRWSLENKIIDYIEKHYNDIENDMNQRNSTSKRKQVPNNGNKTRKKREELSISATKGIKKEDVPIHISL